MAPACPSYELPSRKTLSKYIEKLYQKEHKKIKSSLEDVEFCAITTDGGSTCVQGGIKCGNRGTGFLDSEGSHR